MKFQRKMAPIPVEAVQWFKKDGEVHGVRLCKNYRETGEDAYVLDHPRVGPVPIYSGEWIVTMNDDPFPVEPMRFETLYEPAVEVGGEGG